MKKVKLLVAIILLSFFGFLVAGFKLFNTVQAPQTANVQTDVHGQNSVSLQIDFGDGKTTSFGESLTDEDQTVYSLLEAAAEDKGLELQTQKYDFGVFVKSIEGYESTADKAWIYFVNGEAGTIAADKYTLGPGDKVEWKYMPPAAE